MAEDQEKIAKLLLRAISTLDHIEEMDGTPIERLDVVVLFRAGSTADDGQWIERDGRIRTPMPLCVERDMLADALDAARVVPTHRLEIPAAPPEEWSDGGGGVPPVEGDGDRGG